METMQEPVGPGDLVERLCLATNAHDLQGDTAWSEWEMRGTRGDGSPHLTRGVIIFRMRDGEFSAARFYVEPVEQGAIGIDEVTRQTVQVGAAPMASRPAATPPGAGSNWTER